MASDKYSKNMEVLGVVCSDTPEKSGMIAGIFAGETGELYTELEKLFGKQFLKNKQSL